MPIAVRRRTRAMIAAALAAAASLPGAAAAFTPKTQLAIAEHGARLAPPDLRRQIARHLREYRAGVVGAYRDADPWGHVRNPDGSGSLDAVVAAEAARAVAMIREHRPFAEVVGQLGRVAHYVADGNQPLNASQADGDEPGYFADYCRYIESAQPRFVLVAYGPGVSGGRAAGADAVLARALQRSRAFYPFVGAEYRRIGGASGVAGFDDRSTAFAVAALSVSHALSDVATVLRRIWLDAGGADAPSLDTLAAPAEPPLRLLTTAAAGR